MFLPDKKARQSIAKRLLLDYDETMQDWEYEISDSKRLGEFIAEYDKTDLTYKEKESLMEIILDSANDLLIENNQPEFDKYLPEIKNRLSSNKELHRETINYWRNNEFEISNSL